MVKLAQSELPLAHRHRRENYDDKRWFNRGVWTTGAAIG
jgi:hypothetical protein